MANTESAEIESNKLKLPTGYTLAEGEQFVELEATEEFPDEYWVGPNRPDDEHTASLLRSGVKVYWYSPTNTFVLTASFVGSAVNWLKCGMTRYVVDLFADNNTFSPLGKIVSVKKPAESTTRVKDLLKILSDGT